MDGDTQNVEKEIQDINSRHNTLNTKHESLSKTVQGIAATGGASTATNVTYDNTNSGMTAENIQDAVDELAKEKADSSDVTKQLDKVTIKDEDGTVVDTPFRYIQNAEFIFAKVDAEDKLLFGIQWDGTPKFGKTSEVEDELQKQITLLAERVAAIIGDEDITSTIDTLNELKTFFANIENTQSLTDILANLDKTVIKDEEGNVQNTPFRVIESPEFFKVITDSEGRFLCGIQQDGSVEWSKGIPSPIRAKLQEIVSQIQLQITNLQETKVDKEEGKSLIENEVKECFKVIENDEFIKAVVDSENRVLFGFRRETGKPYYPLNETYHVEQNEEFFALWLDTDNHVLLGIRRDGVIIGEIHAVNALKETIKKIQKDIQDDISSLRDEIGSIDFNLKELLDIFSMQENPEYLAVEKDADERILSATYNDGSHYIHNAKSETIPEEFEHIEDPEGRTEITTDAEGKVMSYRDADGKKHEHKMEVTNLDVSNLNLQGNSVNNIQDALKANGFDVKTPIDWSAYLSNDGKSPLCIPEPRCARINISGIDSMPITKTTNAKAYFEMWDMQGNYFKKKVIMNAQGNSTIQYPKKSFACDFFDSDWNGDSFAIKFGDWVAQDSFHFKAQYSDFFKGISIVAYKLVQEVWASRSPIYSNPWKKALLGNINIASGSYNNENINDLSLQKDTGAKCIPDAFPCVVYLNGEFYGIFNWALKKHRDNYHLDKSSATNIHIDGGYQSFLTPINWKLVEIRNPKVLLTNIPANNGFEAYDGDSPKELLGTDTEGYDPSNNKHKLSAQVKKSVLEFSSLARELNSLTSENGGDAFLNKHYDIDNLIDFYVLQYVLADEDIAYNWQWITYDGIKWFVCDYDKDRTFGQFFNCPGTRPANQMLNAVDVSSNNYPFKYIYTYHKSEIKQRYNELKELGLFTPKHLIDLVKNWFDRYSVEDIKLEYKKWNESPSNRDNNVNNEYWKIKSPYYSTQDENTYDNEKTYNVGETCAYGKGRYTVFECIKESVGNPPITKFYKNIPYDLGYRDSIWRLIKYIQDRFEYIESEINNL